MVLLADWDDRRRRDAEVDLLAKMATHLPVPDYDPTKPWDIAISGGPTPTLPHKWILQRRRVSQLEGVSVLGYPLDVVAPYARRMAYAVDKLAMGTHQVGRHGPHRCPVGSSSYLVSTKSASKRWTRYPWGRFSPRFPPPNDHLTGRTPGDAGVCQQGRLGVCLEWINTNL